MLKKEGGRGGERERKEAFKTILSFVSADKMLLFMHVCVERETFE